MHFDPFDPPPTQQLSIFHNWPLGRSECPKKAMLLMPVWDTQGQGTHSQLNSHMTHEPIIPPAFSVHELLEEESDSDLSFGCRLSPKHALH